MANQIGAVSLGHGHNANYVNVSGDTMTGDLLVMGMVDVDSDLYVVGNLYLESDQFAKSNINPIESSLDKINNIHGNSFDWKDAKKEDGKHFGVIAQEVESVLPELVRTGKNDNKNCLH